MKRELCWPLVAMMLFGLSGCGLKGPLYFPPSEKSKTETVQPDSGKVQKNQQDNSGSQQTQSIAGPQ
ncbi:lipoprotein [Yersinia ruckeri]|uniref:LPS-assembly lipoprotein LptM n=1 Tax=Yersinia ruckeri TaxID=29486 RepID=A0A085U6F6_YERRU|nr:lipoprotein [Yersinia ruckeri]AJI96383.1 prokaryotic lipo-attachment site family protein [Yersinia ruckeri]AKA38573.1 hypothetical protein UGYR_09295 [Yersinia ruckeri]ARZ02662.1 lipoprotein [Yersinia ruckeri]AUQ41384.1 hypothetical protein NJ56_05275 [Yersinia ruckeri]EEP97901.1 hypothetical protein yruck0001_630 [Yersinia ruckeri ATCC 29473]